MLQQIDAYRKLRRFVDRYRKINLLDYDTKTANQHERLRQACVRIGSMDLKIAAISLANGATLLTRNLKHSEQVPGLKAEDWSA